MGCGSSTHEPGSPKEAQPRAGASSGSAADGGGGNSHRKHASGNGDAKAASSSAAAASPRREKDKDKSGGKRHQSGASGGRVSTEERYEITKVLGEGASCKVVYGNTIAVTHITLTRSDSNTALLLPNFSAEPPPVCADTLLCCVVLLFCPFPCSAAREKATGTMLAMKIMDKSESYNKILWENETLILKTLRHKNILEWVESYEDKRTFHLLTVLCQGGELFDRVKNGSFSEKVAARLTKEMLQALHYCHQHNIVHRGQNMHARIAYQQPNT
jgi:serine/threonine protein kinase